MSFTTPVRSSCGKKQITIPPSPFMKKLGFGTGVSVYLLERGTSSPWAVKKSKIAAKEQCYKARLLAEAEILAKLKHPNIVGFKSFVENADGSLCLAMENGEKSLFDLIEHRSETDKSPFPVPNILRVIEDISKALDYLHTEKHLLHGDIKSANVLIQGNFIVAKLCDFGVSLKLDQDLQVLADSPYIGTECYSAIEVIKEDVISHKADIFSFGLVIWEMLALDMPHSDKFPDCDDSLDDSLAMKKDEEYMEALGTRPPLPEIEWSEEYALVLELFVCCTETKRELRPTAADILHRLNNI